MQEQQQDHLAATGGQHRLDRTRTGPKAKLAPRTKRNSNENKNASATKSGPGRFAVHGKPGTRLTKPHAMRAYVALMAAWASKRVTKAALRDEHGAYTLTGKRGNYEVVEGHDEHGDAMVQLCQHQPRKWLGGISAQRGY